MFGGEWATVLVKLLAEKYCNERPAKMARNEESSSFLSDIMIVDGRRYR